MVSLIAFSREAAGSGCGSNEGAMVPRQLLTFTAGKNNLNKETITYSISKTVDSHLHKHLFRPADFLHLWLSVPWRSKLSKAHLPRSFCSSADTEISVITIKQKPQVPRVEG